MIKDKNLDLLVKALIELSHTGFPVQEVTTLLQKNSVSWHGFKNYEFYKPTGYTRNLIYKTPAFELLLLCWMPGQNSPIHGHEGEKCWMRVERGHLKFLNYQEKSPERPELEEISGYQGTSGFVDGPAYIHAVYNVGNTQAASLHLYARPFYRCDIYNLDETKRVKATLSYDSAYGELIK